MLKKLYEGRISRLPYFMSEVYFGILYFLSIAIIAVLPENSAVRNVLEIVFVIIYLLYLVIAFGVVTRRLHDIGQSGWLGLLLFVPLANLVLGLILLFKSSTEDATRYGAPYTKGLAIKSVYGFDR